MDNSEQKYEAFVRDISHTVGKDRIYTDALRRLAWGTDAGFYRLIPRVIVRVKNEEEVIAVLAAASLYRLPVTFRAAGTSLSGQAITDSILVECGTFWNSYRLLDDRATAIALQPGIRGARVDEILKPFGRAFSPDPASKKAAMVGGIVMNNASGMKCGTHANSDRILRNIRIILADGTVLDTADENSREKFRRTHGAVIDEIEMIRQAIAADSQLTEQIRNKYAIKNVTGLNLLPFVLYEDPFDIIAHCMVGSEGTLAFMSEVSVETEAVKPFRASAMLYFSDLGEACRAVVAMKEKSPVVACELLDKKSLKSVHDTTGQGVTALLVQLEAGTDNELKAQIECTLSVLDGFNLFLPARFSSDPAEVAAWWEMRSGVFPAVGGTREPGTTVIIEDIAFHVPDLPEATVELAALLEECDYDACIYGHALEGNFHFIIAQSFATPDDVAKYRNLMEKVEALVIGHFDGSLKAEHGTGRNMAPFVEAEWGTKAWTLMMRLKSAFDPTGILNPGVIFNEDPDCFVHDIKPLPLTNPIVDKCIECGFCEPNCVSCGLALSARQRIIVQREISRLKANGEDDSRLKELEHEFRYYGTDTCAGDGLCSTSCPMGINTADLVHQIRGRELSNNARRLGRFAARRLSLVSSGLRLILGVADAAHTVLGDNAVRGIGKGLHRIGLPLWTPSFPVPFSPRKAVKAAASSSDSPAKLVYFPSCINRTMGQSEEHDTKVKPLVEVFVNLCRKAGFEVIFPENMNNLCCGMIWESKGMEDTADAKVAELDEALWKASQEGKLPVVCDQSPCLHRMRDKITRMKLYEPAEFISDFLAPNLCFHRHDTPVAVHVTCSTRRMGLAPIIIDLARRCSSKVLVPAEVGCCGFAGDKGFTFPELNEWGLRNLRKQIEEAGIRYGYSNSRTCEIGLSTNSGIPYKSIVYLVDECTTARK